MGMRVWRIITRHTDDRPTGIGVTAISAGESGRPEVKHYTMSEDDVRLIMQQPWVAIASDGQAINMQNYPGLPHPRKGRAA